MIVEIKQVRFIEKSTTTTKISKIVTFIIFLTYKDLMASLTQEKIKKLFVLFNEKNYRIFLHKPFMSFVPKSRRRIFILTSSLYREDIDIADLLLFSYPDQYYGNAVNIPK